MWLGLHPFLSHLLQLFCHHIVLWKDFVSICTHFPLKSHTNLKASKFNLPLSESPSAPRTCCSSAIDSHHTFLLRLDFLSRCSRSCACTYFLRLFNFSNIGDAETSLYLSVLTSLLLPVLCLCLLLPVPPCPSPSSSIFDQLRQSLPLQLLYP